MGGSDITSPDYLKTKAPPGFRTKEDGTLEAAPIFNGDPEEEMEDKATFRATIPNLSKKSWSNRPGFVNDWMGDLKAVSASLGGSFSGKGEKYVSIDFKSAAVLKQAIQILIADYHVKPDEISVDFLRSKQAVSDFPSISQVEQLIRQPFPTDIPGESFVRQYANKPLPWWKEMLTRILTYQDDSITQPVVQALRLPAYRHLTPVLESFRIRSSSRKVLKSSTAAQKHRGKFPDVPVFSDDSLYIPGDEQAFGVYNADLEKEFPLKSKVFLPGDIGGTVVDYEGNQLVVRLVNRREVWIDPREVKKGSKRDRGTNTVPWIWSRAQRMAGAGASEKDIRKIYMKERNRLSEYGESVLGANPKRISRNEVLEALTATADAHVEPEAVKYSSRRGTFLVRKGYFYSFGMTAKEWGNRVVRALKKAGFGVELVDTLNKFQSWPKDSYFEAEVKLFRPGEVPSPELSLESEAAPEPLPTEVSPIEAAKKLLKAMAKAHFWEETGPLDPEMIELLDASSESMPDFSRESLMEDLEEIEMDEEDDGDEMGKAARLSREDADEIFDRLTQRKEEALSEQHIPEAFEMKEDSEFEPFMFEDVMVAPPKRRKESSMELAPPADHWGKKRRSKKQ